MCQIGLMPIPYLFSGLMYRVRFVIWSFTFVTLILNKNKFKRIRIFESILLWQVNNTIYPMLKFLPISDEDYYTAHQSIKWESNWLQLHGRETFYVFLNPFLENPKKAFSHWERRGPQTFCSPFVNSMEKIRRLSPKLRRYNFSFETHMYSKVHYFRTKVHYRPVRCNQNFKELRWFGIVLCVHFSVNFHYLDFFSKMAV